jgi:cell division protein FtsN
VVRAEVIRPPSGYERVWGDGRLNTQRGLPAGAIQRTTVRQTARIATPTVTPTSNGHRYVQVGMFGDAGNAARASQRFQGMGLPVAAGRSGSGMQVVAIGPFSNAGDLQRALRAARSAGFSDAFTRN